MSGLPTTTDTFYHGKVIIKQLKKGYRFAVDSPILADFLPRSSRPALEIGCGAGVISLLALQQKNSPGSPVSRSRSRCTAWPWTMPRPTAWAGVSRSSTGISTGSMPVSPMCRPFLQPALFQVRPGPGQPRPDHPPGPLRDRPEPCGPAVWLLLYPGPAGTTLPDLPLCQAKRIAGRGSRPRPLSGRDAPGPAFCRFSARSLFGAAGQNQKILPAS